MPAGYAQHPRRSPDSFPGGRPVRRRSGWGIALVGLIALATGVAPPSATAADLVMVESPGCHWCARWHEEIGPIYPKTAESARAPLRRVNLHDRWPESLRSLRAVSFTPTFILVEDGTELGRITGYAGEDFFWFQLSELLKTLPPSEAAPASEAPKADAAPASDGQ